MANPDPLAALLDLAESVKVAKQVAADAANSVNAAKMAQIKANQDAAELKERAAALDAAEKALAVKTKAHDAAVADHNEKLAKHNEEAKVLAAKSKELTAHEARVNQSLTSAREWEEKAKSYEGQAYAKLEAVRKKLADAETV